MIEFRAAFKVKVEASEIQVGGADDGFAVVADKHFGMDKARLELIDLSLIHI